MNLDFKELSYDAKIKAIQNVISDDPTLNYLTYIISNGEKCHDVFGWFSLKLSIEGSEYWMNIKNEINKKV